MIRTDEDALICDLAETYGIGEYRRLPVRFCATLACGLSDNSRIKLKMSKAKQPLNTILLSIIADGVSWLVWSKTKGAENGENKPASLFEIVTGQTSMHQGFDTVEDFEAARAGIIGDNTNG